MALPKGTFSSSIHLLGWTGAPFRYVLTLVISNNKQLNPRKFSFSSYHKTISFFYFLYSGLDPKLPMTTEVQLIWLHAVVYKN